MGQVKKGDTVKVHYSGSLEDGSVFDSSQDREALQFTMGEGQLIPGFEEAVLGMQVGESKMVKISPEQGYGLHRKELIVEVNREQFPPNLDPAVGQQLQIPQTDGGAVNVTVTAVSESVVTLDANHPLAGKDLTFEITLVEVA